MAELAIAIPEPLAEDPETVVTALETAALFGARGDASEALRWVRHAATSAGENGHDVRALDLARAAADLTPAPPEVAARPRSLPAPPARPSAPLPPLPEAPQVIAIATSTRPPPPSANRPQQPAARPSTAPRENNGAAAPRENSGAARTSEAPRPWPAASPRTSLAPRDSVAPRTSLAPRDSVAPRSSAAPRSSVAPRESLTPHASAAVRELGKPRESAEPRESLEPRESAETLLEPREALTPPLTVASTLAAPIEAAKAVSNLERPVGARRAARVAVTPDRERGAFVLRVLTDDAPLPTGALEAYLVLTDPSAELSLALTAAD